MLFALNANSRAGKRRYSDAYSDDGPPCWVNFLMLIGAIGCLLTSISLFSDSFYQTREAKVQEYSASISNWTKYRNNLLRSNFSVSVEIKDNVQRSTTVNLRKDFSKEVHGLIEEEEDVDLPSYSPLRFDIDSSPHGLLPTLNYTMPPDEKAVFVITASYSTDEGVTKSTMKTAPIPLWTMKVVPGATPVPERKCPDQQHGTWVRNKCEIYHRFLSLCILVELDRSTGTYSLAPQKKTDANSYGCDRKVIDGVRWNPAAYTLVRASAKYDSATQTTNYGFPVTTLDDVSITVRSSHDPLVEAEKATKGSLDFGLSAHNSLVLGIVLSLLGAMLFVSPAIAIRQSYQDYSDVNSQIYSSVKQDYDDFEYEEETGIGGGVPDPGFHPSQIELASSGRTLPRRTRV